MKKIQIIKTYNEACRKLFIQEKIKRKISDEQLSKGICERRTLTNLKNGKTHWTKVTGDILMQRMGVYNEYFEVAASAEELKRWRAREDICLLFGEQPQKAIENIKQYRELYKKRQPVEEQFLLRIEAAILLLENRKESEYKEKVFNMAKRAVECTVSENLYTDLSQLLLAPAELEAFILLAAAYHICGKEEEAWQIQQQVWHYPKQHQWEERMECLIRPQTAILGMILCQKKKEWERAFLMGKRALECLRRHFQQRYVLDLLELLCVIPKEEIAKPQYIEELEKYRQTFLQLYQLYECPNKRIWQTISINNTLEVGTMLRMLRHANKMTQERAISYSHGNEIISEKQLSKIEKGTHIPSTKHYIELLERYGKKEDWKHPLLETNSVEVLSLRQDICTMLSKGQWEQARQAVKRLEKLTDEKEIHVKQHLLSWNVIIDWKMGQISSKQCLLKLLAALNLTISDIKNKNLKYWVFERREGQIASVIADIYRKQGKYEKSEQWYQSLLHSQTMLMNYTKIPTWNYGLTIEGYLGLMGDLKRHEEAIHLADMGIKISLKDSNISDVIPLLYEWVWNIYESARNDTEKQRMYQEKWKNKFIQCHTLAEFYYYNEKIQFLNERKEKYLFIDSGILIGI